MGLRYCWRCCCTEGETEAFKGYGTGPQRTLQVPTSVSNSDSGDVQRSGEGTRRGPRKPEGGRAERGWSGNPGAPGRPGAAGKAGVVTRDEGRGEDGEAGNPEDCEAGTAARSGGDWPAPPGPHLGPRCGRAASRLHTARRGGNGWDSSRGASLGPRAGGRALSRAAGALRHARRGGPLVWRCTPNHRQHLGSPADSWVLPSCLARDPGSSSGPLGPPPAEPASVPADQAFSLGDCAKHPTRRTQRLRLVRPLLVPASAFGKPRPLVSSVVLGLAFEAGEQALLHYRRGEQGSECAWRERLTPPAAPSG